MRILLVSLLLLSVSFGVEIESKDGRKFAANIVSATDSEVTVLKNEDSKTFVLKRNTLSFETNGNIDQFLKQKFITDLPSNGYTNFFFPPDGQVVWIKLPEGLGENNYLTDGQLVYISGGGKFKEVKPEIGGFQQRGNEIRFRLTRQAKMEDAEKIINTSRDHRKKAAEERALQSREAYKELKEFDTQYKIERVKYGSWEGFYLNSYHYGSIEVALINGGDMLYAYVSKMHRDYNPKFTAESLPEILGSTIVTEDKVKGGRRGNGGLQP